MLRRLSGAPALANLCQIGVGAAGELALEGLPQQALAGSARRQDVYKRQSLTPFGASTTTTPAGKREHGCLTQKKSLFDIVAAHRIPYRCV